MKGCFLLLLLTFLVARASVKFETLEAAADSFGQIDIYAPHTVVESRLVDLELHGFMINSVVQVQTPEFLIGIGICSPYTVIRYNGSPAVVSAACEGEEWPKLVTPSSTTLLPLKPFGMVRYDFVDKSLYTLSNGVLTKHLLDGRYNLENTIMGSLTDFYVSGGEIFYIRARRVFRRADGVTEQIGIAGEDGRHKRFYIPSSEASCGSAIKATTIPMLALIFQWLKTYDSFDQVCQS